METVSPPRSRRSPSGRRLLEGSLSLPTSLPWKGRADDARRRRGERVRRDWLLVQRNSKNWMRNLAKLRNPHALEKH